jgi:2-amino-4-hydroxy-6-hydroxymethyldihydropteridine diphosphokinase
VQTWLFIGLGSNLGDRTASLWKAAEALRTAGVTPALASSIYRSEPVEVIDQEEFFNQVIGCRTALPPETVLGHCLEVERSLGRVRTRDKGPRVIDLDLLLYGNEVREGPGLRLPHPRMHLRRFVLIPWHPVLGKSAAELLEVCPDRSRVERLE